MQRDEIGAPQQVWQFDLLDPDLERALRRQERIVGDHFHPQPDGTVGDDRTDIAAPDHAQRLAGDLDAHEAVFLPFAGLGRGIGLEDICRANASINVIACSAVVIELPNGVFITMMPLAVAAGMSTLSTPMPARPITLRFCALLQDFRRDLGCRADCEPIEAID